MNPLNSPKERDRKDESGFTLIEMVLVATLIAILSTMAVASLSQARYKTMESGAATGLKAIASAQEMFYMDNGRYAMGFSALAMTYLPRAYSANAASNKFIKNYSLQWIPPIGGGGPRPPIRNFSIQSYTVFAMPIDPHLKTFVITDGGTVQVAHTLFNWSPY
jgi:prepilin-type N-terminal cleavage/methylation domain-containing protein